MNLDELDRELERWQKDIQNASANLSAFENSTAAQLLKQALPTLTGKSKTELADPYVNMQAIWEQFSLVNDAVKEAFALRQDMPLLIGRSDRIKKIEFILTGPSVRTATKEIPLEQRGLTGSGQTVEKTTIADIFAKMQQEFKSAASAASLYEKLSIELLDKINKAIEEAEKSFDVPSGLCSQLESIRELSSTDPLAANEQLKNVNKKPKNKAATTTTFVAVPPITPSTVSLPKESPKPPIQVKDVPKPVVVSNIPKPTETPKVEKKVDTKVDTDALSKLLVKSAQKPEVKSDAPSKSFEDLLKNRKDNKK